MRNLITSLLLFITIQFQAQNWIGNANFIDLYKQSDIVLIGVISNIEEFKENRFLNMPLKSLTLSSVVEIKGTINKRNIYYRDIFNGCGYAPVLYENILNNKTMIFAKIKNDSIFQIGSMNESPVEIAESIIEYNKIESKINSKNFTNWFFQTSKNKDLFELLNHHIIFESNPINNHLDFLNLSIEQRNKFYDIVESYEDYNINIEGIVSILIKYKDERLKTIIKKFIINQRKDPYSEINDLMEYYYKMTNNKELEKLITQFKNNSRKDSRINLINKFINKI